MSLRDCIARATAAGEMDEARARVARDLFEENLEALRDLPLSQREAEAARRTFDALQFEAAEKRRRLRLQQQTAARVQRELNSYRDARGQRTMAQAFVQLMENIGGSGFSSLRFRKDAIYSTLTRHFSHGLMAFRRNLAGQVRNKAQLENMVREVFGEDTGDLAAREIAQAWKQTAEMARQMFNAAGGRVPRRADWGMPQLHDRSALIRFGREEWKSFIRSRLDPSRMIDEVTGQPITPQRLEQALDDAYLSITTDGWAKRPPSFAQRGLSLANRRLDHRFFVFRNADAWLEYQKRFGSDDPFSVMMGHLNGMARDIARMQILGPNDRATMRWIADQVRREAAVLAARGDKTVRATAEARIFQAEQIYELFVGTTQTPVHEGFASTFGSVRSVLTGAQLGSATLSAVSDTAFGALTRSFVGLPSRRFLGSLVRQMTREGERRAVASGLILENAINVGATQQRYNLDSVQGEVASRIADAVIRGSGLAGWTQAGKHAFGMEFMQFLGENVGRRFEELPRAMQKTLRRHGFNAGQWDEIRRATVYTEEGVPFLRAEEIARLEGRPPGRAEELAFRYMEMIFSETEFAVPSHNLSAKATVLAGTRPGTIGGELLRSGLMYKSFPITLMVTHIRRIVSEISAGNVMGAGAYAGLFVIGTTLLGGLAVQLKELSKGRDPRPMNTAEFWGAALLQGGGLGIVGDFFFSDTNRFGSSLGETIAGPVFGLATDLNKLTVGNLMELAQGEDTNFGAELRRFVGSYTPGGSLWYGRLAFDRLVLDQMQLWADPKARQRFNRMERRYLREFGQRFYWRPGEAAPRRAPDIEAAIGR